MYFTCSDSWKFPYKLADPRVAYHNPQIVNDCICGNLDVCRTLTVLHPQLLDLYLTSESKI